MLAEIAKQTNGAKIYQLQDGQHRKSQEQAQQ
jgi:hypothetical protein